MPAGFAGRLDADFDQNIFRGSVLSAVICSHGELVHAFFAITQLLCVFDEAWMKTGKPDKWNPNIYLHPFVFELYLRFFLFFTDYKPQEYQLHTDVWGHYWMLNFTLQGTTGYSRVCSECQTWMTFQGEHDCLTRLEAAVNSNQMWVPHIHANQ